MNLRILTLSQCSWTRSFRIADETDSLAEKGFDVNGPIGHTINQPGKVYKGVRKWRFFWDTYPNNPRALRMALVPHNAKGAPANHVLSYASFIIFSTLVLLWWRPREKRDAVLYRATSLGVLSMPGLAIRSMHRSA